MFCLESYVGRKVVTRACLQATPQFLLKPQFLYAQNYPLKCFFQPSRHVLLVAVFLSEKIDGSH